MNIQRFTAATSREALAKARMTFGDGTLILSNRPTENGVEVVATAEDAIGSLQDSPPTSSSRSANAAQPRPSSQASVDPNSKAVDDAAQLAMSTLSFQDYVRERMMRKQQESLLIASPTSDASETKPKARPAAALQRPADRSPINKAIGKSRSMDIREEVQSQGVLKELGALREMMEDRFSALAWLGQARQDPIQANLMLKLIRAGYSANLARTVLEKMPPGLNAADSVHWVVDVLERNLRTDADGPLLHEEGGVFALVGTTGVGKTTTAAKLAGICAKTYGAASVGLITLDTYRVGAHDQLRAFGKMLGVVAHLAHDQIALQDLLGLLSNKKMVLVDTTGLAPRDPRRQEVLDTLTVPGVKRLLVLNATAQGDAMDEAVSAFKYQQPQGAVLSKVDEAVKLGTAVDVAIRNQLVLRGITNGQRVPEDWEGADAARLVRMSMRSTGSSAYDPKAADLGFYFSQQGSSIALKVPLHA